MDTDNPAYFIHSINVYCTICVLGIVIDALDITVEHEKTPAFKVLTLNKYINTQRLSNQIEINDLKKISWKSWWLLFLEWSWNGNVNNGNKRNKCKDHERKSMVCLRDRQKTQKTGIQGTFWKRGKCQEIRSKKSETKFCRPQ